METVVCPQLNVRQDGSTTTYELVDVLGDILVSRVNDTVKFVPSIQNKLRQ